MSQSQKLPEVFLLKTLRNNHRMPVKPNISNNLKLVPVENKILNNTNSNHHVSRQCPCLHHQTICDNDDEKFNMKIKQLRCYPKLKKAKLILVIVALVGFVLGLAIPFIFLRSTASDVFNKPKDRHGAGPLSEFLRPQSPLISVTNQLKNNTLENVFISVKTTRKYHYPRLIIQLETWVSLVRSQTWFFTDSYDPDLLDRTNGHLIRTNCSESHSREALTCKMAAEFDSFLQSHKPWWCHFDDDNYVHVLRLSQLLNSFSSDQPVYLGKPSTARPIEIWNYNTPKNMSHFWFATGGAGFCISRTLALKMAPYAANGKLVRTGEEFWFPDDVTLGYIIDHLLNEKLTVVPQFHSHLEAMKSLTYLDQQISFSYSENNNIILSGPFSSEVDPTRFYSLHCHLHGGSYCPSS